MKLTFDEKVDKVLAFVFENRVFEAMFNTGEKVLNKLAEVKQPKFLAKREFAKKD